MKILLRIIKDTCFSSGPDFLCCLKKALKWVIWEFTGFRAIWERICPPEPGESKRRPATFMLWIVGLYTALFGIASTRYEYSLDRIENKVQMVVALNASGVNKEALALIPDIQRIECPPKPYIQNPLSVIVSLYAKTTDKESSEYLKSIIKSRCSSLNNTKLSGINLIGANLSTANFEGADLSFAKLIEVELNKSSLVGANLTWANFQDAKLNNANLQNVKIMKANFRGADLQWANLQGAKLIEDLPEIKNREVSKYLKLPKSIYSKDNIERGMFTGACLLGANLQKVSGLTHEMLSKVKTLYKAKLDPKLHLEIKEKSPYLLQRASAIMYLVKETERHINKYRDGFKVD